MASSISTGTSVTPSNAAKNMEKVFVNASGLNNRPSCASSEKTGMKLTVMTSSAKKRGRPTLLAAEMMTSERESVRAYRRLITLTLFAPPLQRFMSVFDHDDRRVDHGADGNGDAAQGHNV